jgi:hypothetical protein
MSIDEITSSSDVVFQSEREVKELDRVTTVIKPILENTKTDEKASSADHQYTSSLQAGPWYRQVLNTIPRESYLKLEDPRNEIDKLVKEGIKFCEDLEGPSKDLFDEDGDVLGMAGVALIASYLKEKHQLEGLFVCSSLEAFQKKLLEINNSPDDVKVAMVIPWDFTLRADKDAAYQGHPGHKLTVCVEKKSGQTKIAILDSMQGETISPYVVNMPVSHLYEIVINTMDCVIWYINHSGIDLSKTSIYFGDLGVQRTYYGCETFALRNAVSFLRLSDFFEKILSEEVILTENELSLYLHKITHIPLAFLKGVQSRSRLLSLAQEYISNVEPRPPTEELTNLFERLKKHITLVDEKVENHYINHRSHKYHQMVLAACKMVPLEKIEEIVQKTLLVDATPPQPGTPSSPSDAHLEIYNHVVEQTVGDKKERPAVYLKESENTALSEISALLYPEKPSKASGA